MKLSNIIWLFKPFDDMKPLTGTMTNNEDPNEIPHNPIFAKKKSICR